MKSHRKDDDQLILKVLSGNQSGVELALADGEYSLGSGSDDDLQFVDVCLKSAHARIRVEGAAVFIAGGAGVVTNGAGIVVSAGEEEWRKLAPLEIVTIGSGTFAFGPVDSEWSDLLIAPGLADSTRRRRSINLRRHLRSGIARLASAGAAFAMVMLAGSWVLMTVAASGGNTASPAPEQPLKVLRATFDNFPFGHQIEIRQEADGRIYAKGFVEDPAQRRALHHAVDLTGIAVNLRLSVLSSIRSQIAAAIDSFGVDVAFELSDTGSVVLSGEVLPDETAARLVEYVRNEVHGVTEVTSKIATAGSYFNEVKDLAKRSGVDETVLLRLTDQRIEASGVVATDKLDSWVGFIQSYARRYADHISLTSYVQLVNEQGDVLAEANPTRLGGLKQADEHGATQLDLVRVKDGMFEASELFPKPPKDATPPPTQHVSKPATNITLWEGAGELLSLGPEDVKGSAAEGAGNPKDEVAEAVLKAWDKASPTVPTADDGLGLSRRERYLSLVRNPPMGNENCWSGSQLKVTDIPVVLFWLDYLSRSKEVSLATFDTMNQQLLLEAALSPGQTRRCAQRLAHEQNLYFDQSSIFLNEIERNPRFILYLVRDFVPPALDVAGVMSSGSDRYIQLQDGAKLAEGSSPTVESKLITIGSLGAVLRREDGVAPLIYPDKLAWKAAYN